MWWQKIKHSLFLKMMLAFIVGVVVLGIVIVSFVARDSIQSIKAETSTRLQIVSKEKMEKLDQRLTEMERLTEVVASDPYAREYFKEYIQTKVDDPEKKRRISDYLEGVVGKSNGIYENVAYSYQGRTLLDGIGGKSIDRPVKQNQTAYGIIKQSPATGLPVMVNYVMVDNSYMLLLAIDLSKVNKQIIDNGVNGELKTIIINGAGLVIASDQKEQIMKTNLNKLDNRFYNEVLRTGSGIGDVTLNGTPCHAAFEKVGKRDLYLITLIPISACVAKANGIISGFAILLVICLGVGIACLYFWGKRLLIQPIQGLTAATEKMALGDCNVQIDVKTKDEIGRLSQSFNTMVGNIREGAIAAQRIANGDLDVQLPVRSEHDLLNQNLNGMIKNLKAVIQDMNALTEAGYNGMLSYRIDSSKHYGDFQKIVRGVNQTLDAVIEPINESAAVLQEMANGNLRSRVTGNYRGEHARIKDMMNMTLETLQGYVNAISGVLKEMANGNLTVGIEEEYRGDFGEIKESLTLITESLNQVLGDIQVAAEQVSVGAGQMSLSSQTLSQGAAEQASTMEEIGASVTQITSQTHTNAVNANHANQLALNVKKRANEGNQQMVEMLKAMENINESSANISKIIKVIDEIAFQTNILALNAAIEAAWAGQFGKGFAVVAEEVRNLAARSAKAAKETTALIEGSIQKVGIGTDLANDTAKALGQIVEGIAETAQLVDEIATSTNEQANGITQINQGINQVAEVTQSNTATAEQGAASSEELASQAQLLQNMVGRFKLKRSTGQNEPQLQIETEQREERSQENVNPRRRPTNRRIDFGKY